MATDGQGNKYVEFEMSDNEAIRMTLIGHAVWAGEPTIRIQKRTPSGRLAQGPEFPSSLAGRFAKSLTELLAE
jgi:hypothetical protein